jgi:hypothetical protein
VHRGSDDRRRGGDRRPRLARARAGAWLTPARKPVITGVLVVGGVLAAGVVGPTP